MKIKPYCFIIMLVLQVVFILLIIPGCKSPKDLGYGPVFDSLLPPPPPPILIYPINDTGFVIHGAPVSVTFVWAGIVGTEYYRFQYCANKKFETNKVTEIEVQDSTTTVAYGAGDVYWRVCAYCRDWTWYTDWSQIRYFWVIQVH